MSTGSTLLIFCSEIGYFQEKWTYYRVSLNCCFVQDGKAYLSCMSTQASHSEIFFSWFAIRETSLWMFIL